MNTYIVSYTLSKKEEICTPPCFLEKQDAKHHPETNNWSWPEPKVEEHFFLKASTGGLLPTWFYWLIALATWLQRCLQKGRNFELNYITFVVMFSAWLRVEHQASMTFLLFFGILAFHWIASALQDSSRFRRLRCSFRNTTPFLLFQSCQQHKEMKVLYWSTGRFGSLWTQCSWSENCDLPVAQVLTKTELQFGSGRWCGSESLHPCRRLSKWENPRSFCG